MILLCSELDVSRRTCQHLNVVGANSLLLTLYVVLGRPIPSAVLIGDRCPASLPTVLLLHRRALNCTSFRFVLKITKRSAILSHRVLLRD